MAKIPLGKHMTTKPEEIAATAVFLLSAKSAGHITGQHFRRRRVRSPRSRLGLKFTMQASTSLTEINPFVDAHARFWDPTRLAYPWLAEVPAIAAPRTPEHFIAEAAELPAHIVFVQAECDRAHFLDEVQWIARGRRASRVLRGLWRLRPWMAERKPRRRFMRLPAFQLVRGVRHPIQGEGDGSFCLRPEFVAGVQSLGARELTFDICVTHDQLPAAVELVRRCADTMFVLDHAGKPAIRDHLLNPWRSSIEQLARLPNVMCKLSGLVTEAAVPWGKADLEPYVRHLLAYFGPTRLLFGSDWPVNHLAAVSARWLATVRSLLSHLSADERRAVFFENARRCYRLPSSKTTSDIRVI